MVANNLIFFSIWWIFFSHFNDVAGWTLHDMQLLMAVGIGGYGLTMICFGGARNLSKTIMSGDLDVFMTQPKNLLLHIAGSRSYAKGWGHMLTGMVLICLGNFGWLQILLIFLCMVSSCLVISSMTIIAHSLPFWLGSVEGLAKKYCDALFLFALYPTNIYSGLLQMIMFTIIPAGVISYLPVELIREFSLQKLLTLVGTAMLFSITACVVFYRGLKKYESGNRFGIRI